MFVFQVRWIDQKRFLNILSIFKPMVYTYVLYNVLFSKCKFKTGTLATDSVTIYLPHSGTVEINQHPFMRVKVKRISKLQLQQTYELYFLQIVLHITV